MQCPLVVPESLLESSHGRIAGVELGSGWTCKSTARAGGSSAGGCDITFFSPRGKRFPSIAEVRHFSAHDKFCEFDELMS